MRQHASDSRSYDLWLLAGLITYGLIDVAGVTLAALGVVYPPWFVLNFFTFTGPTLGIIGVIAAQTLCSKRPFTWVAVVGSVLAMLLAAFLNFQALSAASAAV